MSAPQFPDFPQRLPTTQAEWDRLAQVMRDWQRVVQPLLQLLDTGPASSATAGTASALPATPSAYLVMTTNGITYKIAGYNP